MTEGEGWGGVQRGKDSLPLHFDFIHHMVHRARVPAETALQSSCSLWVTEGESRTSTQDQKAFHFANGKWWRQLSKGVHCDSPIPNYVIINLIERLQRKYCAPTALLVVLSWIKGTSIHILSFTFTFFYAFILGGVAVEHVCDTDKSICQPTFPCFIPVIDNTSSYTEPFN